MVHICPQLDVRFLSGSNSWIVKGTPNQRTVKQMLNVLSLLAMFLHSSGVHFFSLVLDQISSTKFSIFRSMATW